MCVIIDSSNSKGDGSMKFTISGKNIDVTEGLKAAVNEKLGKLEKYFTPDTNVIVTLSVEKERQKIEVTIPVKGNIIRSEQVSNDMYVSIDLVEEVIERQLRKYKNKIADKQQDRLPPTFSGSRPMADFRHTAFAVSVHPCAHSAVRGGF